MPKVFFRRWSKIPNQIISLSVFLLPMLFILPIKAEIITVNGKVTTGDAAVQYVLVIFEDALDTTQRYTTVTDLLGNYQLELSTTAMKMTNGFQTGFYLEQNYPNPFSSATTIQYSLQRRTDVNLTIYDLLGRVVRKIEPGNQPAGIHWVQWDGRNGYGQRVATGLYFYRLEAGDEVKVMKMVYDGTGGVHRISSIPAYPVQSSKQPLKKNSALQGRNFIVKIANCDTTYPLIEPIQFENIAIAQDTTINFTVSAIPSVTIYSDSLRQYIRGFGAANILPWRPDMTDSEIQKAFGTGDGQIGFSMLRLRLPSDETSWSFDQQVATAKKAYNMGVLIFASPWSPPARMKSNNNTTGGYLLEEHYQAFADHLNSFIDYMADNEVPLYAVSVQNEPDVEVNYESCDWSPEQMRKFMAENAASINTRVIAPESFQFRKNMSDPILNDSAACANLDIVGGHIYGGGLEPYPLAEEKGKEIWMTEHLDTDVSWDAVLRTGKEIHDCMNAGMSAYVWWYIVRFYGPIYDGEMGTQKGAVSKRGYVMSQYARFVRPGYHRIKCHATPQRYVYVSAYKSETGKLVIVAVNQSSLALNQTFILTNNDITALTPYTTSQIKNCEPTDEIAISNRRCMVVLEPSSITTFVSK